MDISKHGYLKCFFILGLLVLLSCNTKKEATEDTAELEGWKLVWSDEFDVDGRPDPDKWDFRIWDPGKVNEELQAYTDDPRNSWVENGKLTISALYNSEESHPYSSARLVTDGLFDFTYGKVEVRAKLPGGRGSWPAIWMLGSNIHEIGWPDCGEIDIMEYVGYDPGVIHGTVHAKNYYWQIDKQQTKQIPAQGVEDEFHIYGIEWHQDRIDFLFDQKVYFTALPQGGDINDMDAWPFSKPHFMILNVAVGGAWGGQKGVDNTAFPMDLVVDYVRVYQEAQ